MESIWLCKLVNIDMATGVHTMQPVLWQMTMKSTWHLPEHCRSTKLCGYPLMVMVLDTRLTLDIFYSIPKIHLYPKEHVLCLQYPFSLGF